MSPHRVERARSRDRSGSSRIVTRSGAHALLRPANRRVTFEIVSGRNSHWNPPRPTEARSHESSSTDSAAVNVLSRPALQQSCRVRDIPRVTDTRSSRVGYTDSEEDGLGSLLMRRTQKRHQYAWARQRRERGILPKAEGFFSPQNQCLVSGLLFLAVLTTYLTLSFNINLTTSVHVTLILLLLLCTILFFHGLLRTWLVRRRLRVDQSRSYYLTHSHRRHRHRSHRRRTPGYPEPLSPFDILPSDDSLYTPTTPVRVHLFRDEEALIGEKDNATVQDTYIDSPYADEDDCDGTLPTPPPPAYGLWRCSVRADPNLLHWSRCGEVDSLGEGNGGSTRTGHGTDATISAPHPPSYAGDNEHSNLGTEYRFELEQPSLPPISGGNDVVGNHSAEVVIPEGDWPLRNTNGAVQEVTRMLLEDQRRHSIL